MTTLRPSHFAALLTWGGLLTLIITISFWLILHPPEMFGIWLGLFLIAPLIIPIRGLLQGRPYTYAAMTLVSLLYILIGITEAVANHAEQGYAYATLLGGAALFIGCNTFVRLDAAERKREAQAQAITTHKEH